MGFCQNCGAQLNEGAQFCSSCGTSVSGSTKVVAPEVVETSSEKKVLAGFAYLSLFVWIYMLLYRKDDKFLAFHANQVLVAMIFSFGLCIIPFLGWILLIPVLVFIIIGLVNAFKGRFVGMPLIGQIKILKYREPSQDKA